MGLLSALVTREAFGRYVVQMGGAASRAAFERLNEVRNARPGLRQLIMRYGEAFLAQMDYPGTRKYAENVMKQYEIYRGGIGK